MLNQKWAEPRPNFGKPTTTGLSTKTELRYKKNLFDPPKNPNLQTESSTQHLKLGAQVVSQHSLGSMNRK